MLGRLAKLADRPQLSRRTVRLRLTLLYGALFLASGAALLAITYGLVSRATGERVLVSFQREPDGLFERLPELPRPEEMQERARQLQIQAERQHSEQLRELLVQSGIALGLMAVVSIGLGWLMAGRVLEPLRTMTATTRRISEHNLHERLAIQGPNDELTELGDTIDDLLARLESAFDAQRRFVANVSHELRTPLAMMRTSLDVATAKPGSTPPEVRALDGKIREGLDRADRLLESFLTLARAQRGALPDRATVSLSDLVSAALAERGGAILAKHIELRREVADVDVVGSAPLLAHLAGNLIDNAIRHNEFSGQIRVVTRDDGDNALLLVESDGRRLQPSEVRELAQPFRRPGGERTDSQNGFGLGLSIVEAIARAHDGRLELEARAEGGLRVEVSLPVARPARSAKGASA